MMLKRRITWLGVLVFFLFSNLHLFAQDIEADTPGDSVHYQWERFTVSLGSFVTLVNSDLALRGTESGLGMSIDLEEAFGLSTSSFALRVESAYNFGSRRRSHFRFGYFFLLRNAVKALEAEIQLRDQIYTVGTEVSSKLNLHLIRFLYEYSVFRDRRIDLSLSGGLYCMPFEYSIGAFGYLEESDSFVMPLPVLGFHMSVFVSPRFLIKQSWEVLYANTRHYQGNINDINLWFEYHPMKNLGIGLGFNSFRFMMAASEDYRAREFSGSFKTGFTGLLIYGKYFF